jgi:hypothetical protein
MTQVPDPPQRVVAVITGPVPGLPEDLVAAMLSDVVDLVATTPQVASAVLATAGQLDVARASLWPGTPVVQVPDRATVRQCLAVVPGSDVVAVALIAADAPDLPGLLLGKLFRSVSGRAEAAVCPADPDGLVAVAARLPLPGWLLGAQVRLGDHDALSALRAVAPPHALSVGPGWHRVRTVSDLGRLDPGLEGWDATRLLVLP